MKNRNLGSLLGILAVIFPAAAHAQSVTFTKFTPLVIRSTETSNILLEVTVSGIPTRVALDLAPAGSSPLLDLVDNGTNGDRLAGDGIYSILLTPAQVVQGLTTDDVFRRFVGFVRIFQGNTLLSSINTFAEIFTPEIPLSTVQVLAADTQATDYVVNIVDPTYSPATTVAGSNSRKNIAKHLYQRFGDVYDVINLVTAGSLVQNRYHESAQNSVQGIGQPLSNITSQYGSAGHLLGLSVFPISSAFDGATVAYVHEFGHQWIQFMQLAPFTDAIPHWPISTLAHGIMGFSIPGPTHQGGSYGCKVVPDPGGVRLLADNTPKVYTDLDLYLMGFFTAGQVGENIVFNDQADPAIQVCNGQVYAGATTRVHASDVVAAFGPRVPSAANSQKQFRVATVVITPDTLLTPEAMSLYTLFAKRAEATQALAVHDGLVKETNNPFFGATAGLGTMTAALVTVSPASLPNAGLATSYSQQLTQSGLLGTPSWTVSAGSLPPGLALSAAGLLSGAPSSMGTFNFVVRASITGYFADQACTISVGQGTPSISVTAPAPNLSGNLVTYSVSVTPAVNGFPGATGTVQFRLNGTATGGLLTLVNGAARLSLAAPASGLYRVSASYGGDSNYLARTAGATSDLIVFQLSIRDDTSGAYLLFNPTASAGVPAGGYYAATCAGGFPPPPPPVTGVGAVSFARCQTILTYQVGSSHYQATVNTCVNQGVVTNGAPILPVVYLRDSNTANNTGFCR